MKIYNPNISKQGIGGGWTFLRNLNKALLGKIEFVNTWQECNIFFITSVTIVDKSEVFEAYKAGKKIVLRVDNMPRKSRNSRMSPHERMKEYAQMASAVVYQSNWAKEWIGSYIGFMEKSSIIYNGVDTEIFKPITKPERDYKIFMYIRYNRDENKRMPEAFDMFTEEWLKNNKHILWLVGRFSPELVQNNFDFFRGEKVKYWGIAETPEVMANFMRQADILLYPSYSDACPNTVTEAKACGVEVWHRGHAGVEEAATIPEPGLERMGKEYLQLFENICK